MVGAIAVERVRALGRDIALRLDAAPHNQRPHKGRGASLHPQRHLDSQLGAHPRPGRGVLQEEVQAQDPTNLGVAIELLVCARHGPCSAVSGKVPGGEGYVLPAELLLHRL